MHQGHQTCRAFCAMGNYTIYMVMWSHPIALSPTSNRWDCTEFDITCGICD